MKKTLFEQFGGTYIKQGDYLLPNLILPAEKETGYIGVWGQRRLNYLKHHRKVLYYYLLASLSCSLSQALLVRKKFDLYILFIHQK